MRLMFPALAAALALSTGCMDSMSRLNPVGGSDPVAQQVDMMKSNAMVPYVVPFHASPKVGQYAVYKDGMGETWYGIVGGKAGAWELEKRSPIAGSDKQLTTLMVVDDKGSVQKAYAGPYVADAKEPAAATEVKVMEKPKDQPAATATKGPEPTWSKDKIEGEEVDKMTLDKTQMWMSPKAYFASYLAVEKPDPRGGAIRTSYDGKVVSERVKQGEGEAKASLVVAK